jgi:hypothetical protein
MQMYGMIRAGDALCRKHDDLPCRIPDHGQVIYGKGIAVDDVLFISK